MVANNVSNEDQIEATRLAPLNAVRNSGEDIPLSLEGMGVDHFGALAVLALQNVVGLGLHREPETA